MKTHLPALAFVLLPCAVSAAEGLDRPTVSVGPYRLTPMANLSYRDDRLELHPKGHVGVGYDSNVFERPDGDETEDGYVSGLAGIEARYYLGDENLLVGDAYVHGRDYFEEDDEDFLGGTAALELTREGMFWTVDVSGAYERTSDGTLETAHGIESQIYGGEFDAVYAGLDLNLGFGLWGRRVDYLEDSAYFSADERDRIQAGARLQGFQERGEATRLGLIAEGYFSTYDHDRERAGGFLSEGWDRYQTAWNTAVMALDRPAYDAAFADFRAATDDYGGAIDALLPAATQTTLAEFVAFRGTWLNLRDLASADDPLAVYGEAYRASLERRAAADVDAAIAAAGLQGYLGTRRVIDPWRDLRDTALLGTYNLPEILTRRMVLDDGNLYADQLPDFGVDSARQDSVGARLLADATWPLGTRTSMVTKLGVEARFFEHDFRGDPDFDDEIVFWPAGELSLNWSYRERDVVSLAFASQLADGITANATGVAGTKLAVRHHLLANRQLMVQASAGYTYRHDSGSDAGQETGYSHTGTGSLNLQYEFRSGLALGITGDYRHVDFEPLSGDYEQYQVEANAAIAF